MNNKRWPILFCLLVFLTGGLLFLQIFRKTEPAAVNMAAVNRIVKSVEEHWPEIQNGTFVMDSSPIYEYSVIGADESLLFRSSAGTPVTVHEAIQASNAVLDVTRNGVICGKVLIVSNYEKRILDARKLMMSVALGLFFLLLISSILYIIFLSRLILTPFQKLKDFARYIALGNLDVPLPMDKSHIFGAFTESFDMMREQLKEYRQREASATQSKKELVASLSHDIKTPVSSIKLVSELLLATETEKNLREKLQTIYQKSEQIDYLITNMLQASLEELGELMVNPVEESSVKLKEMIHQADFYGRADMLPIPECLLWIDPMRMEQVIGNIINNAYKYAGVDTDVPSDSEKMGESGKPYKSGKSIEVVSTMTADGLCIEFRDYGKGVPDEEIPYLFQKFYRGTPHAKKSDGSGLGLYISHCLMEKMNGAITCFNREDGFSVELFIPFAGL